MKSIYKRQFLMVAGMILISFILLGAAFVTLSYRYLFQEKRSTLEKNATYVAEFTGDYLSETRFNTAISDISYREYVSNVAQLADAYVILCETAEDRVGRIVYSSNGTEQGALIGSYIPAETVRTALQGDPYSETGTLGGLFEEKRFAVACPIYKTVFNGFRTERVRSGMVFVVAETENVTTLWRGFLSIFCFTAVVVLCLAFILTTVTTLRQAKPLREMADAARKFGHGEFDTRVEVGERGDEVSELAEAFNAMAESLEQSEARRSEFVANISHELKTPMTTIAGFTDGILDGTIPPERQTEALETISSETRRLSRLVRSMLDLSRLQSAEHVTAQEKFDVSEVLVRVLVSLEGKINEHGLDVDAQLPEEGVKVWGDPDAITQVCYNLLDNAIKFSREGGVITLRITTKGGKALVAIRNEGETIPAEELPLLFDRFHKSDKSRSADREGVGLGLYIVKTILNNHRENITVTSEDGVTEFVFTLMLA